MIDTSVIIASGCWDLLLAQQIRLGNDITCHQLVSFELAIYFGSILARRRCVCDGNGVTLQVDWTVVLLVGTHTHATLRWLSAIRVVLSRLRLIFYNQVSSCSFDWRRHLQALRFFNLWPLYLLRWLLLRRTFRVSFVACRLRVYAVSGVGVGLCVKDVLLRLGYRNCLRILLLLVLMLCHVCDSSLTHLWQTRCVRAEQLWRVSLRLDRTLTHAFLGLGWYHLNYFLPLAVILSVSQLVITLNLCISAWCDMMIRVHS